MSTQLDSLRELVQGIQTFSEEEWKSLSGLFTEFNAGRKEILTRTGEPERYLYFVTEGIQRVYYLDETGREATIVFTYAPSFGGIIDSMALGTPSKYFYETLSPSKFLRATFTQFDALGLEIPAINGLIKKGVMQTLSGVLERLVEVQCFSSEERYRMLLKRSPHILGLIPHKYIANYLGMDATNFSKLLNRVQF